MWRKRLLSLAVVLVPVLACERAPTQVQTPVTPPRAELVQNAWFPYVSDFVTCGGEVLSVVGKVHITSVDRFNDAGKYQTRYQVNIKATATGADGSEYNISNNMTQLTNDVPTDGMVLNWNIKVKLTGKGPAANESYYWLYRGTMNANGDVTSSVNKWTGSC